MHPIERLRSIARARGVDQVVLVREAAGALAQLDGEPGELVTACRRIVALQPAAGSLWWLAARVLSSSAPDREIWRAADAIVADRTDRELAHALPDDAVVASVDLAEPLRRALLRRGDLHVLHVDADGDVGMRGLLRDGLAAGDDHGEVTTVSAAGLGSAVASADLLVVDVLAAGSRHVLAPLGSLAAAAVARHGAVPVWAVAPLGRVLPDALFDALRDRLGAEEPWRRGNELLGVDLLDRVVRPAGLRTPDSLAQPDCGPAPELLVPGDTA